MVVVGGWWGGGGYTEVVAFVHTLRNSNKKSTQVARASAKLCSNNKNFELYTERSRKEYKRIHYFHYNFAFHHSHYITRLASPANILSVQN